MSATIASTRCVPRRFAMRRRVLHGLGGTLSRQLVGVVMQQGVSEALQRHDERIELRAGDSMGTSRKRAGAGRDSGRQFEGGCGTLPALSCLKVFCVIFEMLW